MPILTQAFIVKDKWFWLASPEQKDRELAVICHFAVDHSAVGLCGWAALQGTYPETDSQQSLRGQWSRLPRARGICHAAEPPWPLNPHLQSYSKSKLFWVFWPGIPLPCPLFYLMQQSVCSLSVSGSLLNTGSGDISSHVLVLQQKHHTQKLSTNICLAWHSF